MLLPQELKKYQFSRAVRGYAAAEVEEYIDFLVSKYEAVYRENDELERKLNVALQALDELRAREQKVAALEIVMKETAARLLAEGEAKKQEIIADAAAEAERITAEADAHVASQKALFAQMQAEVAALRDTLFAAYSAHIDRIEQLTELTAGESFGESASVPAASLDEVSEEILPVEDVPAEDVPAEDVEASENAEAAEDAEEIDTAEDDDVQIQFEDLFTAAELTEEESPNSLAEDEEAPFIHFEEDTYTEEELADTDDPFSLNDADSFAEIEEDADSQAEFEDAFEEILFDGEAEVEDEDALLLQELHDTFVHNFDSPKAEETDKKSDSDEDDILKALAEAIGEEETDEDDSFVFLTDNPEEN